MHHICIFRYIEGFEIGKPEIQEHSAETFIAKQIQFCRGRGGYCLLSEFCNYRERLFKRLLMDLRVL